MLVKYQKLQTYYAHDCLENFLLIFFFFVLLTIENFESSNVLARKASSF